MNYSIKIKIVEVSDNFTVCRGKLKIIDSLDGKNHLCLENGEKWCNPIIISEIENIRVADKFYSDGTIHICDGIIGTGLLSNDGDTYWRDRCFRIIVSPKQFTLETLQNITDGKLKDGDAVFVECEDLDGQMGFGGIGKPDKIIHDYRIKLINNHVNIFPINEEAITLMTGKNKQKESWNDIIVRYKQIALNERPIFEDFVKENYNPPTRK